MVHELLLQRTSAHVGIEKATLTAGLVSFMVVCGGLQSRPITGFKTMHVDHTLNHATAIKEYRENGVCVLRNVVSTKWIERMGNAVNRILANPSPGSMEYTLKGKTGRYYGDFFIWRRAM